MRLQGFPRAARWLAAPVALIAIAIYQVHLVQTANLTPWKGGGFGMFSTDRSGASRTVRLYLAASSGGELLQLPVTAPSELQSRMLDLRQMPTLDGARSLARSLARAPWREPAELDALAAGGPAALAAKVMEQRHGDTSNPQLTRLMTLPRAWIAGLRSTARHGAGRPVQFDRVIVEVWEARYDAEGSALRSERLVEATSEPRQLAARAGGDV